ncbi:hypothetical protein QQ045_014522 [Rhodiola kirilowii]
MKTSLRMTKIWIWLNRSGFGVDDGMLRTMTNLCQLASALLSRSIGLGSTVAVVVPTIEWLQSQILESVFGNNGEVPQELIGVLCEMQKSLVLLKSNDENGLKLMVLLDFYGVRQ